MGIEATLLNTSQLACAVHNSLWANDMPNQLIADWDGRPLAVKIHGLLDEEDLMRIDPLIRQAGHFDKTTGEKVRLETPNSWLHEDGPHGTMLPIGYYSGARFPDSVTQAADIIVQQAAGRTDVRATNLRLADGKTGDAPRHFDSPDATFVNEPSEQLGANLHISLIGKAAVELALIDDVAVLEEVAAIECNRQTVTRELDLNARQRDKLISVTDRQLSQLYLSKAVAWARVIVQPGDGLFFQGEARLEQGRYPVAHYFRSANNTDSENRRFAVIKPHYADMEETLQRRQAAEAVLAVTL